jgi:RNA polymerase sigma-70 factor (ECF subfamily)
MPALTDQELVAACLEGRESAYALLVERYTPRLYRIAARICRHPEDAEDAVQETFLQAVRDLRKWKPTAPLEAWLVTITVRTAQKVDIRSNRVASRSDSLDVPHQDGGERELRDRSTASDPAAAAGQADLSARLAAAIADLPDKYRAAVTLRFQEGLSPKEIAATLGIPERTVRTHLLRGLRALRESVGDLDL